MRFPARPQRRNWFFPAILLVILFLQWLALSHATTLLSTTRDESANIVAGLEYWQTGSSMRYSVNPPLVKLWATIPLHFWDRILAPRLPEHLSNSSQNRNEFILGRTLEQSLGEDYFRCLVAARRMCIWFTIVGTVGVYALASLWLSERISVIAAVLWACNPITLGYGSLFTTDIPAASMGCWAVYCGVNAIRQPCVGSIAMAGGMLGLAVLTKLTWILLFPLAFIIAIAVVATQDIYYSDKKTSLPIHKLVVGILTTFFIAWVLILCGYRFEGVFRPLGEYTFISNFLSGGTRNGNLFEGTVFADLYVPIPFPMLIGLDQQWEDFDSPRNCYLAGEWQRGGWYYYYFVAMLVKLPLGWLLLLLLAMSKLGDHRQLSFVCVSVFLSCFVLVSSKTNMNEHTRYLWLVLPQLIVIAAMAFDEPHKRLGKGVNLLLVWSLFTGIWSFPCGISYFNELAGGMRGGRNVLAGSNVDWGHGWISARQWLDQNLAKHPVVVVGTQIDSFAASGIQTSRQAPTNIIESDPWVTVLVSVDTRLNLLRDGQFPGAELAMQDIAGCCVEVYHMRLHDLSQVEWLWVTDHVGKHN